MAVLRVLCRLLWLASLVAAGAAVAIAVLESLGDDFGDLPDKTVLVGLVIVAVTAFMAATVLMVAADRMTERVEREALEGQYLTPAEYEAERLRETPLLAREHNQQRPTPGLGQPRRPS